MWRDEKNSAHKMGGILWKLPVLGALGLVVAASTTGCPAPQDPVQIHGQTHLTLIHTSDIHSRLFPYNFQVGQIDAQLGLGAPDTLAHIGGLSRVSHIVGRERARAGRVLHLDGGDCFQGAPVFNFYSGEAELRALSQMGTDAMVIANHEFDRGATNIMTQINKWSDFPVLAANYLFDSLQMDGNPSLGTMVQPFSTFNLDGLKVAVIGMGNLSTLSSLYESPNRLGIQPLNTQEVAQFYIDLLRPHVDIVVMLTHLGLEVDERMIENTTGIDVVLGGHNHIVLQPPKLVPDCAHVDDKGHHYIDLADSSAQSEGKVATQTRRYCRPRNVLLAHSGAFAKYVGRLDLVVSDDPADLPSGYDPVNKFEVVSHGYQLFPVSEDIPDDPRMVSLLESYKQGLDALVDLDLLVGYAPDGSRRSAANGGDSPLGNLVATAMWLRLGIQTDFSLTNTTGIRADMVPGPVTIEDSYNIFPFDNSISKMQLSGVEVQDLFDFIARRSAGRGCKAQAQIAGVRVVYNCGACSTHTFNCTSDADCGGNQCNVGAGQCAVQPPCADYIYVGAIPDPNDSNKAVACADDSACGGGVRSCDMSSPDAKGLGRCWKRINPIASYELATSNYLAGGGSGYQVLKRNTTQIDTKVEQRDALVDYVRAQKPCGYDPLSATRESLRACSVDADCACRPDETNCPLAGAEYVCACPESSQSSGDKCISARSCGAEGRCVLRTCRDDVAGFHHKTCQSAIIPQLQSKCESSLGACQLAGEACKYLACINNRIGNRSDDRSFMIGR